MKSLRAERSMHISSSRGRSKRCAKRARRSRSFPCRRQSTRTYGASSTVDGGGFVGFLPIGHSSGRRLNPRRKWAGAGGLWPSHRGNHQKWIGLSTRYGLTRNGWGKPGSRTLNGSCIQAAPDGETASHGSARINPQITLCNATVIVGSPIGLDFTERLLRSSGA